MCARVTVLQSNSGCVVASSPAAQTSANRPTRKYTQCTDVMSYYVYTNAVSFICLSVFEHTFYIERTCEPKTMHAVFRKWNTNVFVPNAKHIWCAVRHASSVEKFIVFMAFVLVAQVCWWLSNAPAYRKMLRSILYIGQMCSTRSATHMMCR